ncbi:MAG TPA: hypothetical protein VLH84_05700 [Patescibacteria group bacterium]|nr:hypothetical protein [Patescibacteria group bacterium]
MFGHSNNNRKQDDLNVQVHTAVSTHCFGMAQKIWGENMRSLKVDEGLGKEMLHFAYASPRCMVWLERDHGRTDAFELIVRWQENGVYEVYTIVRGDSEGANATHGRLQALLHSILTVPSIVPTSAPTNVQ